MVLSVRNRLMLLAALSILGTLSVGAVSYLGMARASSAASYANDNTVPSIRVLEEATRGLWMEKFWFWKTLTLTDAGAVTDGKRAILAAAQTFRAALNAYKPLISDDKDRALLVADRTAFEAYDALVAKALVLVGQNRKVEALDMLLDHQAVVDRVLDALEAHEEYDVQLGVAAAAEGVRVTASALRIELVIGSVLGVLVLIGAVIVTRSITRELGGEPADVAAVANRVALGDLSGVIVLRAGDTTSLSASLAKMQASLHERALEDRARARSERERVEGELAAAAANVAARDAWSRQLQGSNQQLEKSNRDLEEFAYIASHDLKAPLNGIDSTALWLAEDLQDALSDESRELLELMRSRIDRMHVLLDDLLAYSRIAHTETAVGEAKMSDILASIVELLNPPAHIRIRVEGELPQIVTASVQLEQVLRNLVSNAIKHHDKERGEVIVSAERVGDIIQFVVRDDGPGIPPEFHERIFQLFQTLKRRDDVEGTGMGLAIVKKLVERQNCHITVHSQGNGTGTQFRFQWPSAPDSNSHTQEVTHA